MICASRFGCQHAADGQVDALGAATRKDDLSRFGVHESGNLLPGALEPVSHTLAEAVHTRRVGIFGPEKREHRLDNAVERLGRRVVVKINVHVEKLRKPVDATATSQ